MKIRQVLFMVMCIVFLSVFPAAAQEGLYVEPPIDVSVNVRSGPGTQYSIRGSLPRGGFLTVTGRNSSLFILPCWIQTDQLWYRVDLNGIEGWVKACAVRFNGELESLPVVSPSTPELLVFRDTSDANINTQRVGTPPEDDFVYGYPRAVVNLRQAPSLNAEVLTIVPVQVPYVYVLVRTSDSRWVKVKYQDKIGWIARYLLLIQPADWETVIPVE